MSRSVRSGRLSAFLLCAGALACGPPQATSGLPNLKSRDRLLVARLRGGNPSKLRPGTTDYSKWEEFAKGVSDNEDSQRGPRVTALERPSKVTFGAGYAEFEVDNADAQGKVGQEGAQIENSTETTGRRREGVRHRSFERLLDESNSIGSRMDGRSSECLASVDSASRPAGRWRYVPEEKPDANMQQPVEAGLEWPRPKGKGGLRPRRMECALELDELEAAAMYAATAEPEFETEEEAKQGTPRELHSTWEHDQRKDKCVTSAWEAQTQSWKPLDYSKWDDLAVSEPGETESGAPRQRAQGQGHSESALDEHDAQVCSQIRAQLQRAIEQDNAAALRRALSHAESMQAAGLMTVDDVAPARAALAQLVASALSPPARSTPASLIEKAGAAAAAAAAALAEESAIEEAAAGAEAGAEGREGVGAAGAGAGGKGLAPTDRERAAHGRRLRVREANARMAREMVETLTRNGAATKQALWSQTQDDVFVYALAPSYTKGRDVSVRLKEKWLRIAVHEPEPRAPSSLAASTPARDRRVRSVILCGKLAFRVRAGDGEELDWEVTDVFDATLAPRRAVRLHLRKRAPGANFVPSHKPAWDAEYTGPGAWRESLVKVWWDRLMKHDAPIPTSAMPDRQHGPAAQMEATWREANEQFKRDVLDMKPVDLSPLLVEGAKERERARVEADLVAHGVPRGSAEWDEAMAQADLRAQDFSQREICEARAWRDQRLADDARELGKHDIGLYNDQIDSQWTTPINSQGDEVLYGGPYWRPTL